MIRNIIKRVLLIFAGIFLSLILLECGLRLAGFASFQYQRYKNNKVLRQKKQYTIMCLGESTTAGQYPIWLQEILNKKYPNKFSVIDCGIAATNLQNILKLLEDNINKYKPNIAICMMGLNNGLTQKRDDIGNIEYIKQSNNINLKIYKLYLLIKQHLKTLIQKEKTVFAEINFKDNNALFEYIIHLKESGKVKEAEKVLKQILKDDLNNETAYVELAILYSDFLYKPVIAYKMAKKGLDKNFSFKKEWYYKIIFQNKQNINELKYYINKMIKEDLYIFNLDIKYFLYGYIKDFVTEEQRQIILETIINNDNSDSREYGLMAIENMSKKEYEKAYEYFNKAEENRLNFPNIETYNLYKLIIKKMIDKNIKVICMQYPVRSIKSLQEQLKEEQYYKELTFISNEKIFKDALMEKKYYEIFVDQFAGDFGHCTNLGNTMIAENIVKTLENMLNLKLNT